MKTKISKLALLILPMTLANVSYAGVLTLDYTNTLSSQLSDTSSNFHPQGLGYDTSSNELLFMQQSADNIFKTDLNGVITGSISTGKHHTTSVAGDGTNYYFSDYTSNTSGPDMFSINKATGSVAQLSTEVAAYGGYPIDVRDGQLYRTQISTSYNWGNLSQIRISDLNDLDTIIDTVNLATTIGIGDIAIDTSRNSAWTLDYTAGALLRQFDLTTGLELSNFNLGLDGLTAGLTYANDTLYYYDWNSGSGSTLSAYSMSDFGGDSQTSAQVPEPSILALMSLGIFGLGLSRRKMKK